MCHTFYIPEEDRSYSLDMLELVDLMDSRLEGRTRNITIHEARNKFPSLKEPTSLPEGFRLTSVIIDEKREANNRHSPYLPCGVTLKYTAEEYPQQWIELGHPFCPPGDNEGPTAQALDWREVTVSGHQATILDVKGSDSLSLNIFESLACMKVYRDSMFTDQIMIDIAESLERVGAGP